MSKTHGPLWENKAKDIEFWQSGIHMCVCFYPCFDMCRVFDGQTHTQKHMSAQLLSVVSFKWSCVR